MDFPLSLNGARPYSNDGRKNIYDLYKNYMRLAKNAFLYDCLYVQKIHVRGNNISLPIISFRSKIKGDAIWLLAGIHGEEPAGPIAISKNTAFLIELGKKIPLVIMPLCNPSGYFRNWRYPYDYKLKGTEQHISVGDSEHYLIDRKTGNALAEKSACPESLALTSFVIGHSKEYRPVLMIDLHEDNDFFDRLVYIYSHGKLKHDDLIARKIVRILKTHGSQIIMNGTTRFGEIIRQGIVSGENDASIDELFSSEKIIIDGKISSGPNAKSVIVVETGIIGEHLAKRVRVHCQIIKSLPAFWTDAKKI